MSFLYTFKDSVALGVGVNLVVHHLVVNGDGVCGQFVFAIKFGIELCGHGNIEGKCELGIVIQVHVRCEFVVGQRIAQDVELLLLDVLVEFLGDLVVQHVSQYALAVHLLDKSDGHHPFAETGYIGFLAQLAQLFGYCLLVICRRERQRDNRGQVFEFRMIDLHNTVLIFIVLYILS